LRKSKRKERRSLHRDRLHGNASVKTKDKKSSNLSMQQDRKKEKLSRQQADDHRTGKAAENEVVGCNCWMERRIRGSRVE
jgi:hypothetical protein